METVSVTTRLPKELKEKATAFAAADERSFSHFVQKAIEDKVAKAEEEQAEQARLEVLFEKARQDHKNGHFFTEEDILARIASFKSKLD